MTTVARPASYGPDDYADARDGLAGTGDGWSLPLKAALPSAVLGGGLLSLAFDPLAMTAAAPLSVAVFVLVTGPLSPAWRTSLITGFGFGLGFLMPHLWWLSGSVPGPAAWLAVSTLEALWFALLGLLVWVLQKAPVSILTIPAAWMTVELVRQQWPFGGFPWGQIGFTAVDGLWASTLPYVGVSGSGFLIAATGVAIASIVRPLNPRPGRSRTRLRSLLLLGLTVAPAVAALLVPFAVGSSSSITVAVAHGNVPGGGTEVPRYHREITRELSDATIDLGRRVTSGASPSPDLVIWPENSTAVDPTSDREAYREVSRAVAGVGAPILVGGILEGPRPGTVLNQGILWDDSGPTGQRYTKRHPVPFGEYIPFRPLLEGLSPRFSEIPGDMLPGRAEPPLDVAFPGGSVLLADAICFDVAYAGPLRHQVSAGAQLVSVQSSNAMFTGTGQREQQFTMTRARALETGRTVMVSTLNGISGVITATGEVVAREDRRATGVLVEDVALHDVLTPAVRFGEAIEVGLVLAMLGGCAGRLGNFVGGLSRLKRDGVCPTEITAPKPN